MGKISSNTVTAQEAIAELTGVDASSFKNDQVTLGSSTVPSMTTGTTVNNQVLDDLSSLVSAVLAQANKFPELARSFETKDGEDASSW